MRRRLPIQRYAVPGPDESASSRPLLRGARWAGPGALAGLLALAAACASGSPAGSGSPSPAELDDGVFEGAPAPSSHLDVRPLAVQGVQGRDKKVDATLTRLLHLAVARTSGATVVDEVEAQASVARCKGEERCLAPAMNDFLNAPYFVAVQVSQLGEGFVASGNANAGVSWIERGTESGTSAAEATVRLGWQLGRILRERVEAEAPPAEGGP